jgi:hypothetical protein
VENKPVITRFFLFTDCCFAILRAQLLQLPASVFSLGTVNPQARNQKRLKAFQEYYENPEDQLDLRRACLNLRLTLVANAICAQKPSDSNGREPSLVRLGKKEVQIRVVEELCVILPALHSDPSLNVTNTVVSLLVTALHVCLRFGEYQNMPFALWTLTGKYNPIDYVLACERLLALPPEELDAGYSLGLQRDALQFPDLAARLDYLLGPWVQSELVALVEKVEATSLDVERKNHQDR